MKQHRLAAAAALLATTSIAGVAAAKNPARGNKSMSASKSIVQNTLNSKDHTTFVAAVKAAGLVDTLSGSGPFTVFAPTNQAFDKLPPGTVAKLLKPVNKAKLQAVLAYHVVRGVVTTKELVDKINAGGGKAELTTVQGEFLTAELKGKHVAIVDPKGDVGVVTIPNVIQSNGVVHIVDTVMLP